jgi:hypothetical protein
MEPLCVPWNSMLIPDNQQFQGPVNYCSIRKFEILEENSLRLRFSSDLAIGDGKTQAKQSVNYSHCFAWV